MSFLAAVVPDPRLSSAFVVPGERSETRDLFIHPDSPTMVPDSARYALGRDDSGGWGDGRRAQVRIRTSDAVRDALALSPKFSGGLGDAGGPAWFGDAVASATGRTRETRLPRPRQTVSQQPRTATSFNRLTLSRRRRAGRDVLPGPPKRGVWLMPPRGGCHPRGLRVLPSFHLLDFSRAFTLACIDPRAVEQCTAALLAGSTEAVSHGRQTPGTQLSRPV